MGDVVDRRRGQMTNQKQISHKKNIHILLFLVVEDCSVGKKMFQYEGKFCFTYYIGEKRSFGSHHLECGVRRSEPQSHMDG